MAIASGLDNLLADCGFLAKRKFALLANHTSVTASFSYSWAEFAKRGLTPVCLFSPEHGLFGQEQDQAAAEDGTVLNIPVKSLYGAGEHTLSPNPENLDLIDTAIFDIQDVGARYYTYAASLILFMKAISGRDIEFIVLDRPNPLGGADIEGPQLRAGFESFVGITPSPVRHGLTVGEIALLATERFKLDVDLRIVKATGWRRHMYFDETGLFWISPSPNLPTLEGALVYPGMCLLEGTNLSEGRGTTRPFEIFGAPFIEPEHLLKHPAIENIAGIALAPFYFKPTFGKHGGRVCGGFFIRVTDRAAFKPFRAGLAIIKAVLDCYPKDFEFLHGTYEFNSAHPAFDLLCGSDEIRGLLSAGADTLSIAEGFAPEEEAAAESLKQFHIY